MVKPFKKMLGKSFHVDWCFHFEWPFLPVCHTKTLSHELLLSGNIHRIKRSIKFKIFIHNHHTRACNWISAELISYVRKAGASFAFPHLLSRAVPLVLLHNFCLKFVDLVTNPRTHLISVQITCYDQGRQRVSCGVVLSALELTSPGTRTRLRRPCQFQCTWTRLRTLWNKEQVEKTAQAYIIQVKRIKIKNTINPSWPGLSCVTRRGPGNSGSKSFKS